MAKDNGLEKKSIHAGHRERLRERFRTAGLASFSEHEVLELLLMFAIPQRDVNPLAHELIARFGKLSHVLEADEEELLRVPGVGKNAAVLLGMMPQMMRYYQLNAQGECPEIHNYADARRYCVPLFWGAQQEHAYLICLDQGGRVLHPALLHTGTIDEVVLYPRLVVETALRHHAHAVLLAHNHPGGSAHASQADIDTTMRMSVLLMQIGIKLVDHVIVAGNDVYSMMRSKRGNASSDEAVSYRAMCERPAARNGMLRDEQSDWIALDTENEEAY